MTFYAIRGAITVDENTPKQILDKTKILLRTITDKNRVENREIISIIFTATKDLDAQYPAVAARELGMVDIPLFCCQEMHVKGSLEKCIRVLIHIQSSRSREIEHVYLEKAMSLRPDLSLKGLLDRKVLNIAIDGPAGAGKSTIAKTISKKLDIIYLDTGAMYRAVAYKMLQENIDLEDSHEVINALNSSNILVEHHNEGQRILLDDKDITPLIRTSQISAAASSVAAIPEVRLKLVEMQRKIAKESSLVMDGRDIGTYVLPHASLKFYITASLDERANRRWKEYGEGGPGKNLEQIRREIEARDAQDQNRDFAPLKKAEDAISIDTTNKSIQQVSDEILVYIKDYICEL